MIDWERVNELRGEVGEDDFAERAGELWGADTPQAVGERRVGQGRVVWGKTAREVLIDDGVLPDERVVRDVPKVEAALRAMLHELKVKGSCHDVKVYRLGNRRIVALHHPPEPPKGEAPSLANAALLTRACAEMGVDMSIFRADAPAFEAD